MRKRSGRAEGLSEDRSDDDRILTEDLLVRSFEGDERAERELFGELQGFLLRELRAHRLAPSALQHCSSNDLVNEVWLRCYSSGALKSFRASGHGSLRRFLCRILNRTLVDVLRRERADKRGGRQRHAAQVSPEPDAPQWEFAAPDPTPSSGARFLEMWELCEATLSPKELDVFRLTEAEGLDGAEIARRLELTPSAVRSLLFRARGKLILAFGQSDAAGEATEG